MGGDSVAGGRGGGKSCEWKPPAWRRTERAADAARSSGRPAINAAGSAAPAVPSRGGPGPAVAAGGSDRSGSGDSCPYPTALLVLLVLLVLLAVLVLRVRVAVLLVGHLGVPHVGPRRNALVHAQWRRPRYPRGALAVKGCFTSGTRGSCSCAQRLHPGVHAGSTCGARAAAWAGRCIFRRRRPVPAGDAGVACTAVPAPVNPMRTALPTGILSRATAGRAGGGDPADTVVRATLRGRCRAAACPMVVWARHRWSVHDALAVMGHGHDATMGGVDPGRVTEPRHAARRRAGSHHRGRGIAPARFPLHRPCRPVPGAGVRAGGVGPYPGRPARAGDRRAGGAASARTVLPATRRRHLAAAHRPGPRRRRCARRGPHLGAAQAGGTEDPDRLHRRHQHGLAGGRHVCRRRHDRGHGGAGHGNGLEAPVRRHHPARGAFLPAQAGRPRQRRHPGRGHQQGRGPDLAGHAAGRADPVDVRAQDPGGQHGQRLRQAADPVPCHRHRPQYRAGGGDRLRQPWPRRCARRCRCRAFSSRW